MKKNEISLIDGRTMEAEMAAARIQGFSREIEHDRAMEIAGRVIITYLFERYGQDRRTF
jgi:hypothetical protein